MRKWLLSLAVVPLAGCGSIAAADLPPAATPVTSPPLADPPEGTVRSTDVRRRNALTLGLDPDALPNTGPPPALTAKANDGRTTLRLDPRTRRVTATGRHAGSVGAGVGPAQLASNGEGTAYVTDVVTDGLTVIRTSPSLAVTRRVGLPGGAPYAIAFDRERYRLWVTLTGTNELVEIQAGSRPRELRRYPTVRFPYGVRVDDTDGTIVVTGRDVEQRIVPTDDDG